jgi:hypothetical protein
MQQLIVVACATIAATKDAKCAHLSAAMAMGARGIVAILFFTQVWTGASNGKLHTVLTA